MAETEQLTTELSVGEQFRQAREKMGLSLENTANKINLRVKILEYIENNDFSHKNIPATFMKGYIRTYAKFLKLPEEIWETTIANLGDTTKHDFNRIARVERVTNPHSHSRWVGYFTTGVVAVVIGMTVLWWWENYQQSNTERDTLVQNYTPSENSVSDNPDNNVALPSPAATVLNNTDSATSALPQTEVPAQASAEMVQAEPVTQPATEQNSSNPMMNEQAAKESAVENSQENQPAANVQGDLHIEVVTATSWISVKDANRKVLAEKEYKKGEILSFDHKGPYSVIIGAPSNVKITYKGEDYPLKVDGRIAKFKL
ncbi:helix-turn-helix domain-containing protein [Actinobacillus porcinus]|uniref:Helix-turn-helix domain-containing protein n=1 Tax=Actinobacillus porcinus TaxID=51048 RepID=A0ABY6TL23_9PAST|nr:RodZ family helix-turn-helix domain-containing protein [Actinobacillus porcinus]VFY93623.1 helix-turn-helix domain-containing protein [Actinobacillus porcinus]VTU08843.1 helix-turn-helix domain-containing protein [Actinobacillus porcinus]